MKASVLILIEASAPQLDSRFRFGSPSSKLCVAMCGPFDSSSSADGARTARETEIAERQKRIDRLQHYSLLVIDDLGVERDTSYSVEQVYNVVDTRARSGKPVIITTNLSLKDLENPPSLAYKRIYDRVLEMCPIKLKLAGESRRTVNAAARRDRAKEILGM